jgi:HIRAN domain.
MTWAAETKLPAMSLAVVGVDHANRDGSDRRFEILLCKPGETVELRPEPRNRHDSRAVAVFSARGVQIGYLTAERCGRFGGLIASAIEIQAVFQKQTQFGAWIRVAFNGDAPIVALDEPASNMVHEPRHALDHDTDFIPDPIWDD